jgi:pimeloyl-ACP methyl ester carboxylesterase
MKPARVIGLVLVAAAISALAYLRFAPDGGHVTVPAGARPGQLSLHECSYSTERGNYAADCGTLVVPENRHDPRSRLIALPVTRVRAQVEHPGAPVFRLEGGPGLSNMKFAKASRFASSHDVVLVGYRGVDGSTQLRCPEVTSAREKSGDLLSEKSFSATAAAFSECAQRLESDGVDLGGYTLPERVDDLEAARRALGYGRIDLVSESAGTRTAMIYGWRYPSSIERSVMIGVNPPGRFLWDVKTTGEQIEKYAALCAKNESCSRRTPDLAASIHNAYQDVPDHWAFLPIEKGNVRAAGFFGLMNATTDGGGPLSGPMTIDGLLSANRGDASGEWLLSLMAQLFFPRAQMWGDVAAVGRSDASYARQLYATSQNRGSVIGAPGTDLVWAGGKLIDAWPASPDENEYTQVRDSNVETLLIGGQLDFATPPQNATRELLPHLPNGRQVVLPGLGHSDDFWSYQPAASSRLVNTFLDQGRVDQSLYRFTGVDFTPSGSHTMIAKIVLGAALGLAALALLSLAWLPWRVHRRGSLGPKASAAMRTLYPLVLGVGGWLGTALVVLATSSTVPIDSEWLVAGSVGVPVGLGIYWAWVRRDRSARTRTAGLAGALAGALIGALAGTAATGGLLAVITAIIGATAGANLSLIVLDIARERGAAQTTRGPAPEPPRRAAFESPAAQPR